jgi:hypothetical protein
MPVNGRSCANTPGGGVGAGVVPPATALGVGSSGDTPVAVGTDVTGSVGIGEGAGDIVSNAATDDAVSAGATAAVAASTAIGVAEGGGGPERPPVQAPRARQHAAARATAGKRELEREK